MKKSKKKRVAGSTKRIGANSGSGSKNKTDSKHSKIPKIQKIPYGTLYVGVDIGGTYVKAALVQLGSEAKIIKQSKRIVEANLGKATSLSNIFLTIEEVIPANAIKQVKAIGVGFPAPVDRNGVADEVTNMPGWEKTNVRKEIEKKFKIKTFVDNDANCFVLGEFYYGAAKGKKNIVGVTLGTGVGGGIIINGKLYRGNTNSAGEFGRSPYKDRMLEQSINISSLRFMSLMDSYDLHKKAQEGDDFAKYILVEYGKELGNILAIIVNFYDPEIVVIGGGLSNFFKGFEKSMEEELQKKIFRKTFAKLRIVKAKSENSGIIGAAILAREKGIV